MASLNFGVTGKDITLAAGFEITDEDATRVLTYLIAGTSYGTVTNDDGTTRQATPTEAATAFAHGILQGLLDQTVRWEKDSAAQQAVSTVVEIPTTVLVDGKLSAAISAQAAAAEAAVVTP